ncbi:MAG: glucosyltransferase domain-containing protein [Lachnospiraceae bacterium]
MDAKKRIQWSALSVVIFSLFAHGYRFANNMYSHDSLLMIYQNDYAWQIALGRVTQPILIFLRGSICNPWLICFLAMLWTVLAVYFLTDLLEISSPPGLVFCSGLMICNTTTISANASYLPWVDFYALACLMSILGVWCLKRCGNVADRNLRQGKNDPADKLLRRDKKAQRRQVFGTLAGILLFSVSMGIYQSYICVAIGLAMILLFRMLYRNRGEKKFVTFAREALRYGLSILLGSGIYFGVWKLFQKVFHIWTSNSYNGLDGLGDYSDTSMVAILRETYAQVGNYLWKPELFSNLFYQGHSLSVVWLWLIRLANVAVVVTILVLLLSFSRKNKCAGWQIALQLLMVLVFPLGINFVCFLSKGMEHTLMIYAFVLIYLIAIALLEERGNMVQACGMKNTEKCGRKTFVSILLMIPFVLVIWNYSIYANQVYLKKELIAEATTQLMNRVVDDIEDQEGYEAGVTPVAFYGNFQTSDYVKELQDFEEIMPYGMGKSAVTYVGADYALLTYILNVNMNLTRVDTANVEIMGQVEAMPCYPSQGSITMVGDTLVVKIAEF